MRRVSFALVLALLIAPPARAQTPEKGTISGHVTDKKTGHAIPFATVSVIGAQRGALTDAEGAYTVTGVPVGTWEVKVQFLGYGPQSRAGVVVTAGKVAPVDFQLQEVVVQQIKAIEVTGERRLVEVKQGATVRGTNAKEIRNLAVTTVADVLQQQAGVSTDAGQIHVRGGRADETIFMVNGVVNRDLVTGQSTASQLNARSVSEVNVATSAYDVRYGNALSGVVEIRLKEGTEKFEGGVTAGTGSYGGRLWQIVAGGPDPVWTPLLRRLGVSVPGSVTSIVDVSSSLAETRFSYLDHTDASLIERTILPPALHERLVSSYEDSFFGVPFRYADSWGPSEDNHHAARYGLLWKPNNHDQYDFTWSKRIAIDQGFNRTFLSAQGDLGDPAFPWQWSHRLAHASTFFEDNVQSSLRWRRSLGTTGFTEAQVSHYFYALRQDVGGKAWWNYVEPDDRGTFPPGDSRRDDYFFDSGDSYQWSDRRTGSYGLDWSITKRNHHNELEGGLTHQAQTVQYTDIEYPWVYDKNGLGQSHDLWETHPSIGALYARDRLEYEGFVANVGLRGDYWVIGKEAENALADTSRHNIPNEERAAFRNDTYSLFGRRTKVHFSPRVIVAHPITENSSFFFNYGEFTQIPSYRYVYSKLNSISSESFPLQGNPNLNPQVSVNYEVGAKDQFLPTAAANLAFFVRDVYDYPSATRVDPLSGSNIQSYFIYLNGHFSRSKGVEVELEKRRAHHWSGKLSYSYQQTKGKSSNPNEDRAIQEIGGSSLTRLSEVFVNWNRPHKLTANFDVRFDDGAPSRFPWLRNWGMNLYLQGQSGRAYTPYDIANQNPIGLPYSQNAPFQMITDLKLNYGFPLWGRRGDFSLQGNNVFSTHVVYRVDPVTGKGYVWGEGAFDPDHVHGLNDYVRTGTAEDPSNYSGGAEWRLQLDVDL
ncbi:MAG: TonB-dependent receptor [Candidatus Eisenbacteria bacterium]|uniref:TonB-dependent receptor n=1 Tax=Eiseniibacteriota bacterium TaxID=2212470 RepID=A0A538UA47_UNCEI|nr:MAG: TonB-dependent receptor [Candidatus Eisenbacteria bacterium]